MENQLPHFFLVDSVITFMEVNCVTLGEHYLNQHFISDGIWKKKMPDAMIRQSTVIYTTIFSMLISNGKKLCCKLFMQHDNKHLKKTTQPLCFSWKNENIYFRNFFVCTTTLIHVPHSTTHEAWGHRDVHLTGSHGTTSYDQRTHKEVHITVSHSTTSYDHSTQREVHITVSHGTTAYDQTTHREVHITMSHGTTSYDQTTHREVHIIVSHSTTLYDGKTEKDQPPTHPKKQTKKHITMPHRTRTRTSKDKGQGPHVWRADNFNPV